MYKICEHEKRKKKKKRMTVPTECVCDLQKLFRTIPQLVQAMRFFNRFSSITKSVEKIASSKRVVNVTVF